MKFKVVFIIFVIFSNLAPSSYALETEYKPNYVEKRVGWLKHSLFHIKENILKKPTYPIRVGEASFKHTEVVSFLKLPTELHMQFIGYLDLRSSMVLRSTCRFYKNLITDDLLFPKIPQKIIGYFPKDTSVSNMLLGNWLYERGLKHNKKKNIKRAAELCHREAKEYLDYQKQRHTQASTYQAGGYYPSGMIVAFAPIPMAVPYCIKF